MDANSPLDHYQYMKGSGPAVSPKSKIGSNLSSEADITLYTLDNVHYKKDNPDSFYMFQSQEKLFTGAFDKDVPAN